MPLPFIIGVKPSRRSIRSLVENSEASVIVLLDNKRIVYNNESKPPILSGVKERLAKWYKLDSTGRTARSYFSMESQTTEICKEISSILQTMIIDKMPLHCKKTGDELNLEDLKKETMSKISESDKKLINMFLNTQIFASYAEHHYNSVN